MQCVISFLYSVIIKIATRKTCRQSSFGTWRGVFREFSPLQTLIITSFVKYICLNLSRRLNFMGANEVFKAKEFYRDRIIEMVNQISRTDILNYIYVVISDIMKERKQCQD